MLDERFQAFFPSADRLRDHLESHEWHPHPDVVETSVSPASSRLAHRSETDPCGKRNREPRQGVAAQRDGVESTPPLRKTGQRKERPRLPWFGPYRVIRGRMCASRATVMG